MLSKLFFLLFIFL